MLSRRRVLLTGGAGFIGSHVAEALLRRGDSVFIVDNFNDFYPKSMKESNWADIAGTGNSRLFRCDICEERQMVSVFEETRPDVVLHLAGQPGVRDSIADPQLYERINAGGTLTVLELSHRFGVGKFIFASSSSVYGPCAKLPFSEEETCLLPSSPYALTKLAGERWAALYSRLYQMQTICLRLFTVFGPRQRPDLAIYKFLSAMESGQVVPVFGDGTSSRDYTFITDIVAGFIAAIEYESLATTGDNFEVFNLGSSISTSLLSLIRTIERVTGRTARIEMQPLQAGDMPFTWANISKAESLLGYKPRTTLEQGITLFVEWLQKSHACKGAYVSTP